MSEHARFSPSSFGRLMQCGGSHALAAYYPDESGPAAEEGTAAHWVAQQLLQHGEVVPVDAVSPNGVIVTQEMTEGAAMYADHVLSATGACPALRVEKRVDCSRLHPDCWGTPDSYAWTDANTLHVFDYKFGHGFVDEIENWQMIAYAAGLLADTVDDQSVVVHMHIIQPRCYHRRGPVRTWAVVASELRPYINRLIGQLADIEQGEAVCTPGGACRYCPARAGCEALQRIGQIGMDVAGQPVPLDLPFPDAAIEHRMLDEAIRLLTARRDGLAEQLESGLRRGARIPGYALETVAGREKWAGAPADVAAVGALYGVDLMRPAEPVTPNQARKLLPASATALVAPLTSRSNTQKLVAVDPRDARRIFGLTASAA